MTYEVSLQNGYILQVRQDNLELANLCKGVSAPKGTPEDEISDLEYAANYGRNEAEVADQRGRSYVEWRCWEEDSAVGKNRVESEKATTFVNVEVRQLDLEYELTDVNMTTTKKYLCEIPGGADADRHRLSEDVIVETRHCLQDVTVLCT